MVCNTLNYVGKTNLTSIKKIKKNRVNPTCKDNSPHYQAYSQNKQPKKITYFVKKKIITKISKHIKKFKL